MNESTLSPAQLAHARTLLAELAIALAVDEASPDAYKRSAGAAAESHPQLLPVDSAARRLSLSRWSIYRLIREKQLHSVKIGARRFVPANEIDRFLAGLQNHVETPS